ncbi:hypothetical protein GF361_00605 [Candidatus Woesearchaeota archaeon]|nr:hypothetical protein [Candidatus Woesearchaeota archaeon]
MLEISQEIDSPISPSLGQSRNEGFVDDKIEEIRTTKADVLDVMEFCMVGDQKIPEPYFRLKKEFDNFYESTVLAIIPYGSMSNPDKISTDKKESWYDAFVITRNKNKFHKACRSMYKREFRGIGKSAGYHSFLEGICSPNYYHFSYNEEGKDVHFKYCPIELEEIERAVEIGDYSLTGRFMKPMKIMDEVNRHVRISLMNVFYNSMVDGAEMAIDIVTDEKKEFTLKQMTYALIGLSYFTDKRLDKNLLNKVDNLYHAEDRKGKGNNYEIILQSILEMEMFDFVKKVKRNVYVNPRRESNALDEAMAGLEKNWKKAVLRMYKGALTNSGSKEYILNKASKAGNLKWWMKPVNLLPNCAMSMLIPLGLAYHGAAEVAKIAGFGPLKKRQKELDAFLDAVKDGDNLEARIKESKKP